MCNITECNMFVTGSTVKCNITAQWVILLCDPDIAEFTQFSDEMNSESSM